MVPATDHHPSDRNITSSSTLLPPPLVQAAKATAVAFATLQPNVNYIISDPILDLVSLVAHRGLSILRCHFCRTYLTSGTIKGHMDGHGFSLNQDAIFAAVKFCQRSGIYSSQKDVLLPGPMGPPVVDLPIVLGYTCQQLECSYAVVDLHTMRTHERSIHGLPTQPTGYTRAQCELQSLFSNPIRYFAVNTTLETCEAPAIVACLAKEFIPSTVQAQPILTASDDRGRTPLEKYLQLDDLLLDVRHSRPHLGHLASLKESHEDTEDAGLYARLDTAVNGWHLSVVTRMKGHPAKFDLERIIIYGPDTIPISR